MDDINNINNNINDDINNDTYVIAFKQIVYCLPIHNYVLNMAAATITYYCGHNNTIIMAIDKINDLIINNKK
jgi:hypothetical protein